jgi:hypothetical protein
MTSSATQHAISNTARTLYLLLYEVADDFLTQRTLYRGDHLRAVAEAHARGELLQGGALVDPADGAALLFATDVAQLWSASPRTTRT